MFEKVNPAHPDKIADRIAGALVDMAYRKEENPRIAVEVLIGHDKCYIFSETSVHLSKEDVNSAVHRIAGLTAVEYDEVPQDSRLARNQYFEMRCGDNGIFRGIPLTFEERRLTRIAQELYSKYGSDGKYLIICQSNAPYADLYKLYPIADINPLGDWTGGLDVDSGGSNRQLSSDMGCSVSGSGLHGKDLSKPDVSLSIYAWLTAQRTIRTVELSCAIGDNQIDRTSYQRIVEYAKLYIKSIGGFEKFAEWGLLR